MTERLIAFQRCFNFRDLGGYAGLDGGTVRWRHLYRSMTPEYMDECDAATLASLGIGLVIDFRGDQFPTSGPFGDTRRLVLGPAFVKRSDEEYERFRATPPEEALPRLLENYGVQYAEALAALAEHRERPAVYHCRLGKDRTGVFSALLLKLLGVSDDDVISDYMLTAEHEPAMRALLATVEGEAAPQEPLVAQEPANRDAIAGVLQRLGSQFGGARGYFARHGIAAAVIDAFIDGAIEHRGGTDAATAIGQSAAALPSRQA